MTDFFMLILLAEVLIKTEPHCSRGVLVCPQSHF